MDLEKKKNLYAVHLCNGVVDCRLSDFLCFSE
jgi:hypothetical protein